MHSFNTSEDTLFNCEQHTDDLVVIERDMLRGILLAVVSSLEAAHSYNCGGAEDESECREIRAAVRENLGAMIGNLERIYASVDKLPTVMLNA